MNSKKVNNLKIYDISDYNIDMLKEKKTVLNKDKFNCNLIAGIGLGVSLSEATSEILFNAIYDSSFLGVSGIAVGVLSLAAGVYGLSESYKLKKECKLVDEKINKLSMKK